MVFDLVSCDGREMKVSYLRYLNAKQLEELVEVLTGGKALKVFKRECDGIYLKNPESNEICSFIFPITDHGHYSLEAITLQYKIDGIDAPISLVNYLRFFTALLKTEVEDLRSKVLVNCPHCGISTPLLKPDQIYPKEIRKTVVCLYCNKEIDFTLSLSVHP